MSMILSPTHKIFGDRFEGQPIASVEVRLGAIDAASRHLRGTGVRAVIYPRTKDGKIRGTGAHPGFVIEVSPSDLSEAGFSDREIWAAAGAPLVTACDARGRPCCDECFAACGEAPSDHGVIEDPCWSCVEMITESMREAAVRASIDASERS